MAKRNFQFKILAYLDSVETNNPEDVIIQTTEKISDDLGSEQVYRIDEIAANTTDQSIEMGFADAKFVFVKNLSGFPIDLKLNNAANTSFTVGAGKVFFLESINSAGNGLISSIYITNSDLANAAKIKLFASN